MPNIRMETAMTDSEKKILTMRATTGGRDIESC